jgi:hypothetical protein
MKPRRSPFADSAPVPVVKEMDGDTGWDEWSRAVQQQDAGYAPTAPASLDARGGNPDAFAPTQALPLQASPAAPPGNEATLQALVQETARDNRICPKPGKWMAMYALLAAHAKDAPLPPPPLTGTVWERTPAGPKRLCFVEHLEWAAANGCLPAVHAFIRSLAEADWHRTT